jgi:hypothetical protein
LRTALALCLALAVIACSGGGSTARTPLPTPSPAPAAGPAAVRDPASAILEDSQVGLARTAGRDHLTAAEAASLDPDQPAAFQLYAGWGWVEESTRSWAGGGSSVDDLVLLSLRPQGAQLAYEHYAQAAEQAPHEGRPCPARIVGLDACIESVTGAQTRVAGRLSEELFVIEGQGVDVEALAAIQARKLRT